MAKKISKTTLYAIQWLNYKKMSIADIAEELNIEEDTVANSISVEAADDPASRLSKLMISETAGKRNKGVAIMTKEASFLSDELSKKNNPNKKDNSNIFRPRG